MQVADRSRVTSKSAGSREDVLWRGRLGSSYRPEPGVSRRAEAGILHVIKLCAAWTRRATFRPWKQPMFRCRILQVGDASLLRRGSALDNACSWPWDMLAC